MNDDLPLIHVFPKGTPSDAELAADRDRKHARDIEEWNAQTDNDDEWEWPVARVVG